MDISVYLLDWQDRRPWVRTSMTDIVTETEDDGIRGVMKAWRSGRYEYSFTIPGLDEWSDAEACEKAYLSQGNNANGRKVRVDRQSMSEADIVEVRGHVYACASFGFVRVTALEGEPDKRIEQSWDAWCDESLPRIGTRALRPRRG